jgi:hypothetical protein
VFIILDEESIDDSYCQCGGKNEYIEETEYYFGNYSLTELNYEDYLKLSKILKKLLFNSLKDHVKKFRIESRIKGIDSFYESRIKYYNSTRFFRLLFP